LVAIGLLHTELVGRYLTQEQFVEAVGITSLLPGGEALKLGWYLGYLLGGWPGVLLGILGTVLPPVLLLVSVGWLVRRVGNRGWLRHFLQGVSPATAALLFYVGQRMIWPLHLNYESLVTVALALGSGVALARKVSPMLVLLSAGVLGVWLL
jgi:chromate transporter